MKYKLFVFDWDGTLMDSEAHIVSSFQASIQDLSLSAKSDDEIKNIIGLGLKEAIDALYPGNDEAFLAQLVARYRHHFLVSHKTQSELFPGTLEVLEALTEQGHYLAVATGKGQAGLRRVLKDTGLGFYFHATRCADETTSKPHPQMLLEIMDELDVAAHETLMIGDTEYDMEMATNAGVAALAVSTGIHERERLLSHDPVACIGHIGEMLDWMQDLNSAG